MANEDGAAVGERLTAASVSAQQPQEALQPPQWDPTRAATLRKLNGDHTWLLSVPTFPRSVKREAGADGVAGVDGAGAGDLTVGSFNLLLDPWLAATSQTDYHARFSSQIRVQPAAVRGLAELEELLAQEASQAAQTADEGREVRPSDRIDAVLVSHPFTDHMHAETLLDANFKRRVPLLGPPASVSALRAMFRSHNVEAQQIHTITTSPLSTEVPPADASSPASDPSPLPAGLRIYHLPAREPAIYALTRGPAWHKLHGGILIAWNYSTEAEGEQDAEAHAKLQWDEKSPRFDALLLTPHGMYPGSVPPWAALGRRRILLHCLDEQTMPRLLGGPVALGAPSALKLCARESFSPQRWIATHDEHKEGSGIVSRVLVRKDWPPDEVRAELAKLAVPPPEARHAKVRAREAALREKTGTSAEVVQQPTELLVLQVGEAVLEI